MTVQGRAGQSALGLQDPRKTQTSWGIKEGFPEEETSELGRTKEEERRKAFQAVSLECTVIQRQGTAQYV